MKIFLDTEFIAGFTSPVFGKKRHFIDLISIGLVDDAGREFYAISNEFDLHYAWDDVWVRDNVLSPLHEEMLSRESQFGRAFFPHLSEPFTKNSLKNLLKWQGKSNNQIADEIRQFVYGPAVSEGEGLDGVDKDIGWWLKDNKIEFYAYYADYDWVLFCSLFGRMIDLPDGFPQYCRDLKQLMDEKGLNQEWKHKVCPDPDGEHNALIDARWNKKLYGVLIQQANLLVAA